MIHLEKWVPNRAISAVYYDGKKELHYVKRFECESTSNKRIVFISESEGSSLDVVSTAFKPEVKIVYNKHLKATKNLPDTILDLSSFIDVKGMKAQGNQLTKLKVKEVLLNHPIGEGKEPWPISTEALQDDSSDEMANLKAAKEHEKFHKEGKVYNRESREQETVKGIYIYGDGWVGKFDDDDFGAFGSINPRKIKIEASETTVDVQANQSELPSDIPF